MRRARLLVLYLMGALGVGIVAAQGADNLTKTCLQGDPDLRIRACTSIIGTGSVSTPDLAEAYRNRGVAYQFKRDLEHAIADYDRAIEVEPDNPRGFYGRGVAFSKRKENARAIAEFSRAVAIDPHYTEALAQRAAAYVEVGNYAKAIADHDQLIAMHPDNAIAWAARGAVYIDAGQTERALQDYDQTNVTLCGAHPPLGGCERQRYRF